MTFPLARRFPRFAALPAMAACLMLLGASAARAQNATTPGAIELYPTFGAIGVRLAYTGDDNANAVAHVEWRPTGSTTWITGVNMTRITNLRWAGSVMALSEDTNYDVRVVVSDPDGGGGGVAGSARTRGPLPLTPTGRSWYVDTRGNDANSGTSTTPFATLQTAASHAQAGDAIYVRPGVYYQAMSAPRAGTAGSPIHLIAQGVGVVLDGSDPASLHRTDWQSEGGGVYSIPFATATRLVVADSLQRLYHQASLAALQANANGVAQGWVIENGRLYVKLEDGSSPTLHTMHIGRYNVGLDIEQGGWRISGFEVRYFGTGAGGFGIYLRGASNCIVTDNHVHSIGGKLICLRVGSADCVLERNTCNDGRISTWPWAAVKAHEEEDTGISNRGGRGNVIRFNTIFGNFNGIDTADGQTDETVAADCDIDDNSISNIGDDAIETDTVSGINLRVMHNELVDIFNGVSMAPNYQGPEYVLYNVITNFRRSALKYSYASSGETWVCQNTMASMVAGAPVVWPTGQYSNQHFRNNLMVTTGIEVVSDDGGESQTGIDFQNDLLWAPGSATLFRWKGVNYATLSALQSALGFETAGRSADPRFLSSGTGDFALVTGSPAVDAGMRLPGINDRFNGLAPDIGALESGDAVRPAAITDLH
ncbi:MAG TPA: right-handed parallel beta-helix repeat-containing protein [Candidatus Eisenbacteria bacterium]|nr:right-handed parallel beta-helix repeat-containing protein [Candidatus Eisenbacteria bacterium]